VGSVDQLLTLRGPSTASGSPPDGRGGNGTRGPLVILVTELVACDILPVTKHESVLPESVQEALGQLVGAAQEGLLALSVGVGQRFAAARARPVRRVRRGHRFGYQALMATSPTSTCGGLMARLLRFAAIQSLAIWIDASAPAWSS
jgi:hypothetical protein